MEMSGEALMLQTWSCSERAGSAWKAIHRHPAWARTERERKQKSKTKNSNNEVTNGRTSEKAKNAAIVNETIILEKLDTLRATTLFQSDRIPQTRASI